MAETLRRVSASFLEFFTKYFDEKFSHYLSDRFFVFLWH